MSTLQKILTIFLFSFIFFLVSARAVSAKIELSFTQPPSELHGDQAFQTDVTLKGVDESSEYYIRGVFYKADSSQYFGFTKNNEGNWQSEAQNFTQFYKIKGNTTVSISFKPDVASSSYVHDSTYLFKIGRYTPGGSLTWSDQSPATILLSSPTIENTPTPSPSIVNEAVTSTPTSTPTASPTPPLTTTPTTTLTATPTPTQVPDLAPNSVTLSEVMACPESGQSEWVELKNQTASVLTITNWKIKDSTDTHSISVNDSIGSYGYLVVSLSSSMFNNTGDSVRLYNASGTLIDQMSYTICSPGTTFIRVNDQWQMTKHPTQGGGNEYEPIVTNTPSPKSSSDSSQKDDTESEQTETPTPSAQRNVTKLEFTSEDELNSVEGTAEPELHITQDSSEESPATQSIEEPQLTVDDSPFVSFISQSTAFLLGGCSYILTAALLAQKWYTLTSA